LAYLKALLHFNDMSKETVMQASYFYPDSGTVSMGMECTNASSEIQNKGFHDRSLMFKGSRNVEMCGPLISDLLFNSSGVLMPKSDYFIRMYRQPHTFCLMSEESGAAYKLKVQIFYIYVKVNYFI